MYEHKADYTNTFGSDLRGSAKVFWAIPDFIQWKKRWKERCGQNEGGWEEAQELMKTGNPAVIPRNHRVEEALRGAVQSSDYAPLRKLLRILEHPFAHTPEQREFAKPPDPSALPYRTFCGT